MVLEIKKNKLLMNVLKIMPLSVYFSLFLFLKSYLVICSLPGVSYQIPPLHPAERSEYQSHLSKGIHTCSHHFHSSGHTHACHHIQTSVTSLLPPPPKEGGSGFPVESKGRYTPNIKDITHHQLQRLNSRTYCSHLGRFFFSYILYLHTTISVGC